MRRTQALHRFYWLVLPMRYLRLLGFTTDPVDTVFMAAIVLQASTRGERGQR